MKKNRATILLRKILDHITNGDLRPGDRLPPEPELAAVHQVSRATIRQVLKSLESVGLVKSSPRKGTVLADPDPSAMASLFGAHMALAEVTGDQIARARFVLEEGIARLAAVNRTENDLKIMTQILEAWDSAGKGAEVFRLEQEFHSALVDAAHNPVLSGFRNILTLYFNRTVLSEKNRGKNRKSTRTQHRAIFCAVREQDPENAGEMMRRHLYGILQEGQAHG